ncbi:hypothetical protein G7046_g4661 [Stylonectria norvegica]|nr:hypothetical protein G7046_g4661 [Stylonectria norvegica]
MSQYGYGYRPPQGNQPIQSYPSYGFQQYQPTNLTAVHPVGHGNATQESYEYNRNAIPGLGMGRANSGTAWQQDVTNALPGLQPESLRSALTERVVHPDGSAPEGTTTSQNKPTSGSSGDDAMEEGELSEGESEDIYEPGDAEKPTSGPSNPGSRGLPASEFRPSQVAAPPGAANHATSNGLGQNNSTKQQTRPTRPGRERSGSYSPYLSPQEFQLNDQGTSTRDTNDAIMRDSKQSATSSLLRQPMNGHAWEQHARQSSPEQIASMPVEDARRRAREAILRLWPLNVRYQNYIDEGIDSDILSSLFTELGLEAAVKNSQSGQPEVPEPKQTLPKQVKPILPAVQPLETKQPPPSQSAQLSQSSPAQQTPLKRSVEPAENQKAAPETAKVPEVIAVTKEQVAKPKDKSEARKDRIARLLAAKGSKSNVPSPEATAVETTPPLPNPPVLENSQVEKETSPPPKVAPPNKTQSKKSELLQKRLEALKKSREAKSEATREATARKPTQVQELVTPNAGISVSEPSTSSSTPGPQSKPTEKARVEASDLVDTSNQVLESSEKADVDGAAPPIPGPIPGLFLSSTSQPPPPQPPVNQRKRPVAADLNDSSTASAPKRPFGQARESRPFLIDVSDDEDDAEMEIDSPEQRSSSLHRQTTPSGKTSSFRDYPSLSDNFHSRQFASPSASATPTGRPPGTSSVYDLNSMTKKIEDMKRKIAEAEARKARNSRQGSPSHAQALDHQKEGSTESSSKPTKTATTPIAAPASLARAETADPVSSTPLKPLPATQTSQKAPEAPRQSPQPRPTLRARAVSERLPLLEAHRREQLSQLKHLQSEVARIEKEIQDSMLEEERLREQSMDVDDEQPPDVSIPNIPTPEPTLAAPRLESQPASVSDHEARPVTEDVVVPIVNGVSQFLVVGQSLDRGSAEPTIATGFPEPVATVDEPVPEVTNSPSYESVTSSNISVPAAEVQQAEGSSSSVALDEDVAMEEVVDSSSDEDEGEASDGYDPDEILPESPIHDDTEKSPSFSPAPASQAVALETSDTDVQDVSPIIPASQPVSVADVDLEPESGREVEQARDGSNTKAPKTSFVPYESPLQCFRAYRFHPNFGETVQGGLRSLTYSNKIDVRKEVCPDQFSRGGCPRGNECKFQHFESIQAPDDQILLQLGAYGNYEGEQKQQYITGLRELLTDFRNRKVKDFQTISQGIIEYRAQFHGDKTKILPLGSVTL